MVFESFETQQDSALSIYDKTLRKLHRFWRSIWKRSPRLKDLQRQLPEEDLSRLRSLIEDCLSCTNEVTARGKASRLGSFYQSLEEEGRRRFLHLLTDSFGLDLDRLREQLDHFTRQPGSPDGYVRLKQATVPDRFRLLKMFSAMPEGFRFLVELRSDLLRFMEDAPSLSVIDYDLRQLFELWFDVDLLSFERITWNSPASVLEKLMEYEEVHSIPSWDNLKKRLAEDRRCYAFFHPKIPREPLIFVELALTREIPDRLEPILDGEIAPGHPREATTAVFYSISSTQEGLRGVHFGNFLLKRVIDELSEDLPQLEYYVTLSPLPGFRTWLLRRLRSQPDRLLSLLSDRIRDGLTEALGRPEGEGAIPDGLEKLSGQPEPEIPSTVEDALVRFCAYYLLEARREDGMPLDPVARFHLRNGARVERITGCTNRTRRGMEQSFGLMVNYRYEPDKIESNHEMIFQQQTVPARSSLRGLIGGSSSPDDRG